MRDVGEAGDRRRQRPPAPPIAHLGSIPLASVHYDTATEVRAMRNDVLAQASAENPARVRYRKPTAPKLPTIAWIKDPDNPLAQSAQTRTVLPSLTFSAAGVIRRAWL